MKKLPDWQILFNQFVLENQTKKFVWGKWDCCLFSDACIKAMTGETLIPKQLKWHNKETAMKSIKDYGKTLKGSITKACKEKKIETIDANYITTGDLVVYKEETELVGISDGFNILAPSEEGIATKDHSLILKVWRISG